MPVGHFSRIATIAWLLFFSLTIVSAQTTPARTPPSALEPKGTQDLGLQVEILRAQNAEIRSFNDRILSTVWGALGVIGGVTVLLVGYSWFSSKRSFENDRDALAKDLSGEVKKLEGELVGRIEVEIGAMKKGLDPLVAEKSKVIKASLNSKIEDLEQRVIDLQIAHVEREFEEAKKAGYFGSAMRCATKYLELAHEEKYHLYLDDGLAMMADIVGAIEAVPKGAYNHTTDPGTVEDAIKAIEKSTHHKAVGAKLRDRLLALPV